MLVGVESSVETLEHWFNGLRGMTRRDLYLRHNPAGPLWEIESRQAGRTTLGEFATEERARTVLGGLLASGTWQRVDG
jgi:hypothetical protein